jgi:type I restriction enzyme M protein
MHDVHYKRFDIKNEDTLERPLHLDMRFEAIVANPPFRLIGLPVLYERRPFSAYGKLISSKADFAFVQHMVHQLTITELWQLFSPRCLFFRGGAEGHIRQYLIKEKNYLDAVIGCLPIFLRNEYPDLYFGFEANGCQKHFVYRCQPTFLKR